MAKTFNVKSVIQKLEKQIASDDVIYKNVKINGVDGVIVFVDSLSNKTTIAEILIKPLTEFVGDVNDANIFNAILAPAVTKVDKLNVAINNIFEGNTMLFVDGLSVCFAVDLKYVEKRSITEPPNATVLKGPREGFVESIQSNICLIRRKIISPKLKCEYLTVGKYSQTKVALVYIDGVCKKGIKQKIIKSLNKFTIDACLDSAYVAKIITENKTSLFKQVGSTEKPDILCGKIMEGRIGIIVDGSPVAITVPYLIIEDFQSAQDYYTSVYHANTSRFLRVIAVIISIMLPSFYVSAQIFHLQLIPLPFLLTIVNSVKDIPLSPSTEMFLTLIIFEILNEASIRMSRHVGMVVSIVGGLVLGETAVNAGIISPPALMIMAFSGICLYTVPDLEQIFSILRAVFLIIAGTVGGYGLIIASCFILIYLTSAEFFDTPCLAPFSPIVTKDIKDSVFKTILISNKTRPKSLKSPNKTRVKQNFI